MNNPTVVEAPPKSSATNWSVGTLTYTRGGLATVFFWLLWGDLAWSIRDRVIPPVMQLLFKKYEVSDTMAGLLFSSFPIALGLVTGPFISYLSDRHRGPRGRRIPFIFWTTPFIVVSIVGLAFSPQLGGFVHAFLGETFKLNTMILVTLGTFCLIFEFFCGVANSLYGALVNDVAPQSLLGRFFALFRIVSLVVGIVFNYWLFAKAEANYVWFFLGIGVLYGVGFTLMCVKVKEGQYPPPAPRSSSGPVERFKTAAKAYLKAGYGNSYYLWFFGVWTLANLVTVPVNLYNVFFAKSLDMSMATYGKFMAASFVVSLCLAFPLGYLSDRFHPLRTTILALAAYLIVMLWGFVYAKDAATFGIALVGHTILSGCLFTVLLSLPQKLLPRDQFAQITSAGGTITCLVGIGLAPALGMLLDATGHAYRYTFGVAFCIGAVALLLSLVLHKKFMALGGVKAYVPPV